MRLDQLVQRRKDEAQLDHYKRAFKECQPLLDAVKQLNDAFIQGVATERTRILTATKNLTYEGTPP